jgi:hypothetical protein
MSDSNLSPNGDWTPVVALDVMTATQKAFDEKHREFYRVTRDWPVRLDLLTTGWHLVTPQTAEQLLLGKANRHISLATVAYYARQMMEGKWKATGEPIIITSDGVMRDAYHRCWSSYLSGASFRTFVVTDVEPTPDLFAFIDNGKARTDTDALETAGMNGLSAIIAATVKIAVKYERGAYHPQSRTRIPRMTPIEVLDYVRERPDLHDAVNVVISEHKQVLAELMPHKKDVACFAGWQITKGHSELITEEFFTDLGKEHTVQGPIGLLRAKLMADADGRTDLSKKEVLAFIIKAFNAWYEGRSMRRLILGTDEPFPEFDIRDDDGDAEEQQPRQLGFADRPGA